MPSVHPYVKPVLSHPKMLPSLITYLCLQNLPSRIICLHPVTTAHLAVLHADGGRPPFRRAVPLHHRQPLAPLSIPEIRSRVWPCHSSRPACSRDMYQQRKPVRVTGGAGSVATTQRLIYRAPLSTRWLLPSSPVRLGAIEYISSISARRQWKSSRNIHTLLVRRRWWGRWWLRIMRGGGG